MEHVNDTNIKQSEEAMYEITVLVASIQQLCSDACQNSEANHEAYAQICAIRHLASLAGYNADLAIGKLSNGPGVYGDAEKWLCSPAYNKLSQQPAVMA
jgi:hypothetical protein